MELSDFVDYVGLDFKRTDKETELIQAYNDMINWVSLQMPHSGYKFQSYVSLTVGVDDYPLPCDLVHLIHPAKLIIGTGPSDSGYPLDYISKQEYDSIEPNPNRSSPYSGRPAKYTVFNRNILLTPPPDSAAYLLEINWAKRKTTLTDDTDMPHLKPEWDEVLKWGTLERLYAGLGLTQESTFWGSKYHAITSEGNDFPVGVCRTLLYLERNREGTEIGIVVPNNL